MSTSAQIEELEMGVPNQTLLSQLSSSPAYRFIEHLKKKTIRRLSHMLGVPP